MAGINILDLLRKGKNPQQLAEQLFAQQFGNDPLMTQLLQMGRTGNTKGVEDFAKQFMNQRGLDYNKELQNLMSLINK